MNCFTSTCLVALMSALVSPLGAATMDIQFSPTEGIEPDGVYQDGSTRSVGTNAVPGLVATLTGRGYGLERTSSARWGIQAGPLAGNPGQSGWTIRNGFAPDRSGEMLSTEKKVEVDASYLSFFFPGVSAGTILQEVSLTFSGVRNLKLDKAWAGLSVDNFTTETGVKLNNAGGVPKISLTFPDFTYMGGGPLEIRVYGVMGEDTGSFDLLTITGQTIETNPIPEPDSRFLVTAVALGAVVSFRRRRSDLPRFH